MAECELWGHAPESIQALRAILDTHPKTLQLEMAMSIDAFDLFVRFTYDLEADTMLVFVVHQKVQALIAHVALVRQGGAGCPNTRAIATKFIDEDFPGDLQAAKDAKVTALITEQLEKVEPSFVFFDQKLIDLAEPLAIFDSCRLFDPRCIAALAQDADEVERMLKRFPFVTAATVVVLLAHLAEYTARAAANPVTLDDDGNACIDAWWNDAEVDCPHWFETAKQVMILQPSSAAAERIFSMLKAIMGDQQQARAKEDYQEAAIMTRYNELQRAK